MQSSATLREEKLSHMEWKKEEEIWEGFARFFTYKEDCNKITFRTRKVICRSGERKKLLLK